LLEVARLAAVRCESAPALEIAQGNLPEALSKRAPADLVLASYALTELAPAALAEALEKLWTQTTEMLVVVEPGTPEGFRRILQIRAWLIAHAGHIAAPCTHAEGCPLATAERWCHFSQRLPRRRDHLLVKSASVNYEDEKFSYLAVSKTPLRNDAARRILSTPRVDKNAVRLTLCAPDKVEECVIERSDKEAYKKARHYDWGALRAADASGALHAADASGGPAL
jgi:ribosomal protein RSM22 (predicted rRNA methylase)